jgi:hypothetical protein
MPKLTMTATNGWRTSLLHSVRLQGHRGAATATLPLLLLLLHVTF